MADPVHREEGGTPAIIESIRAGLVFQLKDAVSEKVILEQEENFVRRALNQWSSNPHIRILGNLDAPRLSIISFVINHGDLYLHHNFVVALLNDLFGIQSRGGCSCAGPYGHRLLGIDGDTSRRFEDEIEQGCEILKPGWVRVNFNYFISETVFQFIVDAVDWVAREGYRFLPHYRFNVTTGQWAFAHADVDAKRSLFDLSYREGVPQCVLQSKQAPETEIISYLDEADRLAEEYGKAPHGSLSAIALNTNQESLRWFALPDHQGAGTGFRLHF